MKTRIFISFCLLFSFLYLKGEIPTNGLVLYLPLNGNANDSSSYANNGVNYGSTPIADRFGKSKKSMYFNGASRIEIPSSASLNLTNNKTLSCWVYIPSTVTLNSYPALIWKDEPLYSTTYTIQLNEYYGYSSDYHYKFDFFFSSGYAHYQSLSKELYTSYKDKWFHIAATYDTISCYSKIYINGHINDSLYIGKKQSNYSNLPLYIGSGRQFTDNRMCFNGNIDEVRLYNRAVTKTEVYNMYMEGICSTSTKNDTTTFYINNESFKSISPQYQLTGTESLKTKISGCDSIINHYSKFVYSNTTGILSTSDTRSSITIYPNPARDYVTITFSNFTKPSGNFMVVRDVLGKAVYSAPIIEESTNLSVKGWNGSGLYLVQIFDIKNSLIDTRKLIVR